MSTIGAPTPRGVPSVGCVCIRMPGPAFTSMITAPFSRNGTEMLSVMTSIPATSSPIAAAAISHAVTLSGCISSVRSIDVPPVERFAVWRRNTCWPSAGTVSSVSPCDARKAIVSSSVGRCVRIFVCPIPRRGSRFSSLDQRAHRLRPVADDARRHALGARHDLAVHHEHAVVVAERELLDHHAAAERLRDVERAAQRRPRRRGVARSRGHGSRRAA